MAGYLGLSASVFAQESKADASPSKVFLLGCLVLLLVFLSAAVLWSLKRRPNVNLREGMGLRAKRETSRGQTRLGVRALFFLADWFAFAMWQVVNLFATIPVTYEMWEFPPWYAAVLGLIIIVSLLRTNLGDPGYNKMVFWWLQVAGLMVVSFCVIDLWVRTAPFSQLLQWWFAVRFFPLPCYLWRPGGKDGRFRLSLGRCIGAVLLYAVPTAFMVLMDAIF